MRDIWEVQRYQRERAAMEGVADPYYTFHRLCPMCGGEGGFRGSTNDFIECPACEATGRQDQKGWLQFRITIYRDELNGLGMEIMDAEYSLPRSDPFIKECRDREAFVAVRISALSSELEALS